MSKKASLALVITLFLSLAITITPVASGATVVKVNPALIEYHEDATGQQFTINVTIVDVTNLYGFDLKFRWNTTYLSYVSRSVLVPRNTYPGGVLWNPILNVTDGVNMTAGTYWIAKASMWPAPSFNGSGTVFTMTFEVIYHPVQPEPDADITLELYSTDLSNPNGDPIPHTNENGVVRLYALPATPHDIAVSDVKASKTVVNQNYSVNVSVTLANQGDYAETYTITLYANTTSIAAQTSNLDASSIITIVFKWTTSSIAKGNYSLWAYVLPVPGETDTADNNFTDGWIKITIVGDVNGDGKVNLIDVFAVALAYGSYPGHPTWNPNYDINNDGKINLIDYFTAALNYGKTDP